jgi:transposase
VSDTELLLKSKPEAVQRLEVFIGSGRRRTWSTEQKARIVAESYESGDPVSRVAPLFGWRRAARRTTEEASAKGLVFAPVIVDAAPPCVEASTARRVTLSGQRRSRSRLGLPRFGLRPGLIQQGWLRCCAPCGAQRLPRCAKSIRPWPSCVLGSTSNLTGDARTCNPVRYNSIGKRGLAQGTCCANPIWTRKH